MRSFMFITFSQYFLVRLSTGKVSNGWIRDLGFNLRLYQNQIGVVGTKYKTSGP